MRKVKLRGSKMIHVVDAQQGDPKNDFNPLSEEGRGLDLWHKGVPICVLEPKAHNEVTLLPFRFCIFKFEKQLMIINNIN